MIKKQPAWTISGSADNKRQLQLTKNQSHLLRVCANFIATLKQNRPLTESDEATLRAHIQLLLQSGLTAEWIEDNLPLRKGAVERIIGTQP